MLPIQFIYPEDRNGTNPENRIVDERHTITPANGADFNFLIPRAAPYFENSMTVTHVASGSVLIKGIDWTPSYKFDSASNTAPYLQVYGGINLLTSAYDGATLSLDYQTLGGAYVLDESDLTTVLANTVIDPRLTSWESVTLVPGVYLPEPHLHNVIDTIGYDDLVAAVRALVDKFTLESGTLMQMLQTHIDDINNPHETNLVKLGISRFANVYKASQTEADAGTNDINYVTVALVKYMLENYDFELNVTKEDVGLGNLNNWLIASVPEAVSGDVERYLTADVFRAALDQILSTLPLSQINAMQTALNDHIANTDNPHNVTLAQLNIAKAINGVGDRGDVPFYVGSAEALDTVAGQIMNRVAVVTNQTDLTSQLAYTESFAEVFTSWRRVAFSNGNPEALVNELSGWSYDSATDKVSSTINSGSYIGLISPDKIDGDYVFDVGLRSTNTDDDFIGVSLGLIPDGENFKHLVVLRAASHSSQSAGALGGSLRLILIDSSGSTTLKSIEALTSYTNGWAGYGALGEVRLKVSRVGTVLTIQTGDAGAALSQSFQFDLASNSRTVDFAGAVNLGYSAFSQANATWTTYERTGANPVIVATHTSQVYRWTGNSYSTTAEKPADVILRGRFYRNPTTKRVYYATADGVATLVAGNGVAKDITSSTAILDKNVYVNTESRMAVGSYTDHWAQNPTNGTMTYRGYTAKTDGTSYDIRSVGNGVSSTLWLGDEAKRHSAIKAETSGAIGFTNAAGTLTAYLDAAGVFQHAGINRTSDQSVKQISHELDYDAFDIDDLGLFSWVWSQDERVHENLRGKNDTGIIAQQVEKVFPNCVSRNSETGLLTVDDAKLAVHLSIILLKKLKKAGI